MLARRCPLPGHLSLTQSVGALLVSCLAVISAVVLPMGAAQAQSLRTPVGASDVPIVAGVHAWPNGTITVYDATDEPDAVDRALAMWNTSSAGVSFQKVLDINAADVRIENRDLPGSDCQGQAMVGYYEGWQSSVQIDASADPRKCTWASHILLVAHELGHVAGLPHITGHCSLMNPSNTGYSPAECKAPKWAGTKLWRCRGPEPVDLLTLAQLYPAKSPSLSRGTWCKVPSAER